VYPDLQESWPLHSTVTSVAKKASMAALLQELSPTQ